MVTAPERPAPDFGAMIKRAREGRGVSLRQIASATKISVAALEALERNDISRLPGGIFSRAFVRSYAVEVGLDPERTVREFLEQFPHDSVTAGSPHVPQEDHEAIESERQSAQTALKLVAISLPLAGVILYMTLGRTPGTTAGPVSSPAVAPVAERTAPAAVPVPGDGSDLPPAAPSGALLFALVARAPVTLDVTIDGEPRGVSTLGAGERLMLQADREMSLAMSDAGAIELLVNQQPTIALGASGKPGTVTIGRHNLDAFLRNP